MARPIDEKIVKMTLDNEKFHTDVKKTLSTFGELNSRIKSINPIDVSNIAKGISAIEKRFSSTGAFVGSVINRMTNSAITFGKGLYDSMVDPLVEGGKKRALNIEQAKFQFEGLGMDVEKTMDSALEAVKGTAFGLDEAAVVASQFGATGMRAGKEMTESLRGISGVAAMTGASYSDIGNIFTTVAGNGRLMGNDLLRLGARGVNAAATLGKAMNKSEQEIRSMVTKGQISFKDFSKAMSDAFGEHATKANETYAGSLSNLRAALSRIGAEIFAPEFEYKRNIFNALTPKVDEFAEAIGPVLDTINLIKKNLTDSLIKRIEKIDFSKFQDLGGFDNIEAIIMDLADSAFGVGKILKNAFGEIFNLDISNSAFKITDAIQKVTGALNNFITNPVNSGKIQRIFAGVFAVFDSVFQIAKQLGQAIFNIFPKESKDTGFLEFLAGLGDMVVGFNKSLKEGNKLTEWISKFGGWLRKAGVWLRDTAIDVVDFFKGVKDSVGTSVDWIKEKLGPVAGTIAEVFSGLEFKHLVGAGGVLAGLAIIKKIFDTFKKAKSGFGIKETVTNIVDGITGSFDAFQKKVKYDSLLKIAGAIGILVVSIKLLEGIEVKDIAKGVITIATLMGTLVGTMYLLDKVSEGMKIRDVIKIVTVTTLLTTVVTMLAGVAAALSFLDTKSLLAAVGALGLIFLEIGVFLSLVKKTDVGITSMMGLVGVAGAIGLLALSVAKLGDIETNKLIKGLTATSVLMLVVGLFSKFGGGSGNLIVASGGLILMSVALQQLVKPISELGKLSWSAVAKGLVAVAGALAILAGGAYLLTFGIVGALVFPVLALGLNMIIPPLKEFAAMSWGGMFKGLTLMTIGLVGLGVAGGILTILSPLLLIGGAALLVFASAAMVGGAALSLIATGLSALASISGLAARGLIEVLGILVDGVAGLAVNIANAVVAIGVALLDGFNTMSGKFFDTVVGFLLGIGRRIEENIGEFIYIGASIILKILQGITEYVPVLMEATMQMMLSVILGMANAIENNGDSIRIAMTRLMGEVLLIMITAGADMVTAIFGWIPGVEGAMDDVVKSAETVVRENFRTEDIAIDKGTEFANSLGGTKDKSESAASDIIGKAKDGLQSLDLGDVGDDQGDSWVSSLLSKLTPSGDAGSDLATKARDGAASVSFEGTATDSISEFVKGMVGGKTRTKRSGEDVAIFGRQGMDGVKYNAPGTKAVEEFANSMYKTRGRAKTSGSDIAKSGREGVSGVSLITQGINFGNSFSSGMENARTTIFNKAKSLATTASNAVKNWLQIASPSKLLVSMGRFFSEGFAFGIVDRTVNAVKAAKEMAVSVVDAMDEGLDGFDDDNVIEYKIIVDDSDFDPDDFNGGPYPVPLRPDPGLTAALVSATDSQFRQNRNNHNDNDSGQGSNVEYNYHYDVNIDANGSLSRSDIKRYANLFQEEIKKHEDSVRTSRGERVTY